MFVPHARVRLTGVPAPGRRRRGAARRQRAARRKLKLKEHLRMPCLLPTCASCLFGLVVLLGGAAMSLVGYHPMFADGHDPRGNHTVTTTEGSVTLRYTMYRHPGIKALSYLGPIFMGCGLFIMIIAGVLYCEIIDKYVNIEQEKTLKLPKEELYEIIINELRKNYFRGIEVPLPNINGERPRSNSIKKTLFKALSISTPALLLTPEISRRWQKRTNMLSRKYQEEVQEKIKLKLFPTGDTWVKTSSLPNITPKEESVKQEAPCDDVVSAKYLETKRISRSCGNVTDIFSETADNSHLSSSCFDNPAYIPDMDKTKVIALVREHCKQLVRSTESKCSVRWKDERGSDVNIRARHPLATKEELRLFDSVDEGSRLCVGSTPSLKEVQNHPLQSSSLECDELNGDSDVEVGRANCITKHVSVIIHKASVHQPDDRNDVTNMQRNSGKSYFSDSDRRSGNDQLEVNWSDRSSSGIGEGGHFRPPNSPNHSILPVEDEADSDSFSLSNVLHHVDMSRVTHL
ncbi:uncharacterized protein LOC124146299 [Haliotis rufescens]|uniref:uncharacterized protein LOC124146299 n=1 Tax=Haliotis rufescens TaxID=6454 RepID=UPI001EB09AEA|nr:uncharacterized protein LOC124146299 [Haliotis rufescens]XP_048256050.1 uncharacterized protein LOC124146299 [Haliotis rufescens]